MAKNTTDTTQKKTRPQKDATAKAVENREDSTGTESQESETDGDEQNKIEETLKIFRENVTALGYMGIEKPMIPIVMEHGTTKDKVGLMVNAHFDMLKFGEEPKISLNQAKQIRAEVKTHGRTEMVEYMNCLSIYDALQHITNHLLRYKYAYLTTAYQSTIYFQTYEWLGKAEELFNKVATLVDPNKKEDFKKVAEDYNNYLQHFQRFGSLNEVNGEGWIDKQRENCLEYAKELCKGANPFSCEYRHSQLKGAIDAIEQWINDNDAQIFVSLFLRQQLILFRTASPILELQDKYYYSHLKMMEDRGETPTDEDRELAIFPDYSEVERDEHTYKIIYEKLNDYKQVYK